MPLRCFNRFAPIAVRLRKRLKILNACRFLISVIVADENINSLLAIDDLATLILRYLHSNLSSNAGRKCLIEILRFLVQLSKSEFGILKIVDTFVLDE